jgi:dTDP-4-amino-4,6-dideoxygalactose transaminase
MEKPAVLGGPKEFEKFLPIVKPALPGLPVIQDKVAKILATGMVSNFSENVRAFEEACRQYIGAEHALSQCNATTGLLLVLQALGLKGEVIVPSFTFSATVHALVWNNLTPKFVDIDPKTYNVDPAAVEKAITPKTSAIIGVHVFGNPCDIKELEAIAAKNRLKLVFDSAHGFGSKYQGGKIGTFGDAEIFSMSPTKLLVTGEGGLVTTKHKDLYEKVRLGRNYGDPGNYNCQFVGFNSKMQEFSAILGLESIKTVDEQVANRNRIVEAFRKRLSQLPGVSFQVIKPGNLCSYKDLSIVIEPRAFGMSRDMLYDALTQENIQCRKYFYPPVHEYEAYAAYGREYQGKLPVTDAVSRNILCLPLYSYMDDPIIDKICHAIEKIQHFSKDVAMKGASK